MQTGVAYTNFHNLESGVNVVMTKNSDWTTNCPEHKVTAVQVVAHAKKSEWQREYEQFSEAQENAVPDSAVRGEAR